MSHASSRVCCLLLHRSRVHLLINLITSNSALVLKTAFPTSCKCARIISLFFVVINKNQLHQCNTAQKQHNVEFWCEPSLIIWSRGSNTTHSVGFFLFFLYFFLFFSALGSASFSLDTYYKVNSNCTLGHSGETEGCPQAKALSRTLKCELSCYWFAYFSLAMMHAAW